MSQAGGYDFLCMVRLIPQIDDLLIKLLLNISTYKLYVASCFDNLTVYSSAYQIFTSLKRGVDFQKFIGECGDLKSNLSLKTTENFIDFARNFINETQGILAEIRQSHDKRLGVEPSK